MFSHQLCLYLCLPCALAKQLHGIAGYKLKETQLWISQCRIEADDIQYIHQIQTGLKSSSAEQRKGNGLTDLRLRYNMKIAPKLLYPW